MSMPIMLQLAGKRNRIEINLTALPMGVNDLCIVLTGGEAHLGAVTVAHSGAILETISINKHLEHILTKRLGEILNKELAGSFAICCGIHYDNITKQEIEDVMDIAHELVVDLCAWVRDHRNSN